MDKLETIKNSLKNHPNIIIADSRLISHENFYNLYFKNSTTENYSQIIPFEHRFITYSKINISDQFELNILLGSLIPISNNGKSYSYSPKRQIYLGKLSYEEIIGTEIINHNRQLNQEHSELSKLLERFKNEEKKDIIFKIVVYLFPNKKLIEEMDLNFEDDIIQQYNDYHLPKKGLLKRIFSR
ncbi:MAG: hypothetical protein KKF52_01020 [Nanoarchaeota archaeon]|nr:hypothetical protein [Nanoarchaeota archaeon]MBU4352058.1 hypothetical protein [Nanoarchaeota archaeon]